jgi:peptidyl-prolyl cis-trans isomerase C
MHNILAAAPRIPIKVAGVIIPHAAISREAQNHPAQSPAAAWRLAALALVLREALSQEADRLGIHAEPVSDSSGRRETEGEARIRALIETEVKAPEPSEEECRRYYDHNPARFRSPDICEVAHILCLARRDDAAAYDAARQQAFAIIRELAVNPGSFDRLARLHSGCPSRKDGGRLGQVTARQTTREFAAALRALRPGETSPAPVEAPYGLHVIRLDHRIGGSARPFEAVRNRIAEYLTTAARRRSQAQFAAQLLGRTKVEGFEIPAPGELSVL